MRTRALLPLAMEHSSEVTRCPPVDSWSLILLWFGGDDDDGGGEEGERCSWRLSTTAGLASPMWWLWPLNFFKCFHKTLEYFFLLDSLVNLNSSLSIRYLWKDRTDCCWLKKGASQLMRHVTCLFICMDLLNSFFLTRNLHFWHHQKQTQVKSSKKKSCPAKPKWQTIIDTTQLCTTSNILAHTKQQKWLQNFNFDKHSKVKKLKKKLKIVQNTFFLN